MSHGRQPEIEFFPFLERFHVIMFVTSSYSHQQELFLSVVRSQATPKKETFDFRLPSLAHERPCLSSLIEKRASDFEKVY